MHILVTGGTGFIGSAVIRLLIRESDWQVLNVDKLTDAASAEALAKVADDPRYTFIKGDICDHALFKDIFESFRPDIVMHLAAESHVDRSIDAPADFIQTNIVGTFELLRVALDYWLRLPAKRQSTFRFHHISTDEVFGSLGPEGLFSEESPYQPNSPYSASKAAADHLVRAWNRTYGLPVVLSNCSNNYGPYQFPEKLIPLMTINALEGKPLPVYGNGENVRDWLYVEDHARALVLIASEGAVGESYNVGASAERTNIQVVRDICAILDEMCPDSPHRPRSQLITFVEDRPGHDARYAIDAGKIRNELGWRPRQSFESGLRKTVEWYCKNRDYWIRIRAELYGGERLGLSPKKISRRSPGLTGARGQAIPTNFAPHTLQIGFDRIGGK